jgi:hypothetical protein
MNFNEAGEQRTFDLITSGTIVTVHMTIRPGGVGEGGWLRRSKDGNSELLDIEFTVVGGEFAKRKFWTLLTVRGTTEGHAEAARISSSRLRAILESVRGISPADNNEAANKARQINNWGDFDGMRFVARIGVEPARGNFKAKNTLDMVITPDQQAWRKVEQIAKPAAPATMSVRSTLSTASKPRPDAGISRPQWGMPE